MPEIRSVVSGMVRCDTKLGGKTVLITGANSGVGFMAALDMLRRGARLIMACRNMSKMEDAKAKLLEEVKDADIFLQTLDLASLASVRECAKQVNEREERLDILINNAGVMLCPPGKTKDGFDMQFGVNHVGHFLLTNLLLDLIKKSAPSRIINVSSLAHGFNGILWEDINQSRNFNSLKAYGQSKSANILHCLELSKRLEGTGVTCYSLHPGGIKTNLQQHLGDLSHLPFWTRLFVSTWNPSLRLFGISPEKGAQTTIYCAVAPELEKETGNYYSNCSVTTPSRHCRNAEDAKKLWELTEEMIKNVEKTNGSTEENVVEVKQEEKKEAAKQEVKEMNGAAAGNSSGELETTEETVSSEEQLFTLGDDDKANQEAQYEEFPKEQDETKEAECAVGDANDVQEEAKN